MIKNLGEISKRSLIRQNLIREIKAGKEDLPSGTLIRHLDIPQEILLECGFTYNKNYDQWTTQRKLHLPSWMWKLYLRYALRK